MKKGKMALTYSYDPSTDIGEVRLAIHDKTAGDWIFADEEIQVALNKCGGDTDRAAAWCLRSMASDKARLAKAVKVGNWSEDTKGVPDALIKAAEALEKGVSERPAFGYASQDVTDFQYRERIRRESLTSEVE